MLAPSQLRNSPELVRELGLTRLPKPWKTMENHREMPIGGTKCIQMVANHCKTLFCTSLKWFPSLPCPLCKLSMIFHKNLMGNHRIPSLQALRILTVRQAQLGSAQLDSARLSSAELRSARLGSTRLISARARAQPRHKSTPFPPRTPIIDRWVYS